MGDPEMMALDLLIRNARLRSGKICDMGILDGKIHAMDEHLPSFAETTLDAGGNLVTESFCNPHLHLDKVYTRLNFDDEAMKDYQCGDRGKAMTAIESASRVKETYTAEGAIENIRKAVRLAAQNGTLHIRAFADVDNKARLEGVKALIQVREEFQGVVDIQVVAFPQDGVVREPGAAELVREAMKLGADVVGGIPWIEYTDADAQSHIDQMFAIAREFDADVSMLVDDAGDPGLRTTEMIAVKAIEMGWEDRVLAHHARAMSLYPKPYFQKLAALLKRAGMGIVTDPHTGPLHARVQELLEERCLVALGQDDISDAYYPYGQNNMLEVAFLASHLLWMTTRPEMETLYDMITVNAARAMGIENHPLKVGNPANLVVLDVSDVLEALRYHRPPVQVIREGKTLLP
jgi:cytosine/creatinine deaminase